jgi:hypothetical protein
MPVFWLAVSVATTADEVAGALKGLVWPREITVIGHSAGLANPHQKVLPQRRCSLGS